MGYCFSYPYKGCSFNFNELKVPKVMESLCSIKFIYNQKNSLTLVHLKL